MVMSGCWARNAAMRPGVMVVSSASATTRVIFFPAGTAVATGPVPAAVGPLAEAPGVRALRAARVDTPAAPAAARKARRDSACLEAGESGEGAGLMGSPGTAGRGASGQVRQSG